MYKKTITLFFLIAFSSSVFGAGIYKCKDKNGQFTFSNKRCNVMKPSEGKIGENTLDFGPSRNAAPSSQYSEGGISNSERRLKQVESEQRASASRNRKNWREKKARALLNNLPYGKFGDKGRREQMIREADMLLR